MKGATVNISMMLTVLLAAALAAGACRKTDVEINDGSGSGGSVSEDVPMTFSVSADAHKPAKSVITAGNFRTAGNTVRVYDRLTVGNRTDLYINGRDAEYRNDPQILPDGTVTSAGWHFMDGSRYWTRSGTHLFTAFLSGYHVADKNKTNPCGSSRAPRTVLGSVSAPKAISLSETMNFRLSPKVFMSRR